MKCLKPWFNINVNGMCVIDEKEKAREDRTPEVRINRNPRQKGKQGNLGTNGTQGPGIQDPKGDQGERACTLFRRI